MTAREMAVTIGKVGTIDVSGLKVKVRIEDVRVRFGRTDYLVVPVAGSGGKWTIAEAVRLESA